MVRKAKPETLSSAFSTGHRSGLVALGINLADAIDATDPTDSTPYHRLVRAFLATCRQIESIDRALAGAASGARNGSAAPTAGRLSAVDEVTARRQARGRAS